METLLEILATPKQVGILIGAGVSKACGLPNVDDLTKEVKKIIIEEKFLELLNENDNLEVILSKLHQLKYLLSSGKKLNELSFDGVVDIEKI